MPGQLIPLGGGDVIPLSGTQLLIGRSDSCDIVLRANGVSSQHCRISWKSGQWHVEDLGSRNGIRVNRQRCDTSVLESGSTLWIGGQRFEVHYGPVSAADEDLAMSLLEADPPTVSKAVVKDSTNAVLTPGAVTANPTDESQQLRDAAAEPRRAAARSRPRRYLGKLTPAGGGEPIPLLMEELLIGRHPRCDIVLKFKSVSGRHCRFTYRDGHWYVEDLASSNGTRINDVHVTDSILMPGDTIRFGRQRYEISYKPEGEAPAPADPFAQSLLQKAGLEQQIQRNPEAAWLRSDQDQEPSRRVDLETLE